MQQELVSIGVIVAAHGLKGEVRVRLFYDGPRRLEASTRLFLVQPEQSSPPLAVTIRQVRYIKAQPVVLFHELSDRTEAENCRGFVLMVPEKDMVALKEHEYFCHELLGCLVLDRQNKEFGQVTDIYETGSNDVLVITGDKGELLVPFLKSVIVELNVDQKRLIIDPLPGLFDPDED